MILIQGNWNYDINITPSKGGMFSWVVIRFPVGMTVATGQSVAAGMSNSSEEAEREAENARRRIMAEDSKS